MPEAGKPLYRTMKEQAQAEIGAMKHERSSFWTHWREISQFVDPRRGRFFVTDRNKGDKRYHSIINNHASYAKRVFQAGMLAGVASAARPWFAYRTLNPDLMENQANREWLFRVAELHRAILNEGNFYRMASQFLGEAGTFATACMTHVNDFSDVARYYTHTVGSYMIGQDDRLEFNRLGREFEWTTSQIVKGFSQGDRINPAISTNVKNAWDHGDYHLWFPVSHVIFPNPDYQPGSPISTKKRFRSLYFEPGQGNDKENDFLSDSGFDLFPGYALRWEVAGEDIYGTNCPGMIALGDVKQLQDQEKEKGKGIQKMISPPLTGPSTLNDKPVNSLPGGGTFFRGDDTRQQLRSIYEVNVPLQELRLDMDAVERRIDQAYMVDMFLAISNIQGIQPRNEQDLILRNEERLLQIGPALERVHGDFLKPMLNRLFMQTSDAGLLPPPPPDLEGAELKIAFVSTLAMAQQAVATGNIERVTAFAANLAKAGWAGALDKIDADQAVDKYGESVGVTPDVIVPDRIVAENRAAARAEAERQQALQEAQVMANTAKMASDAKTDDQSVLTELRGNG